MSQWKLLLIFLLFVRASVAHAEIYTIELKSATELINLAAIEIQLETDPPAAFIIDENFTVEANHIKLQDNDLFFKVVDPKHSLIRIFFSDRAAAVNPYVDISISGRLSRSNYSGDIETKIANIKYISDFARGIDTKKIESSIRVQKEEEPLPFAGITKAEILGPKERIFSHNMFITIGNIETYGFSGNKSVSNVKVNGQDGKFINDNMVTANLNLEKIPPNGELEINLSIEIDGHIINKKVGLIKIIEASGS